MRILYNHGMGDLYKITYAKVDYIPRSPRSLCSRMSQELQFVEFFAGVGNTWKAVSHHYPGARVDLEYDPQHAKPGWKQSPMDILSSAVFTKLAFNELKVIATKKSPILHYKPSFQSTCLMLTFLVIHCDQS